MKVYEGEYQDGDPQVYVRENVRGNRRLLDPQYFVFPRSPDGFSWGYAGSGPTQLAFALLFDLFGKEFALQWHGPFKWRAIAQLPMKQDWSLSEQQVREVIDVLKAESKGTS